MQTPEGITYPISTVDAVVLTLQDDTLKLLLHKRPRAPYEGVWALPGGFIHTDKDVDAEAAIRRILMDKTGTSGFYLEQLATYSGPTRDPRGWSLSIAHLALVPYESLGTELGADAALMPADKLPPLAFDHGKIVEAAIARLRGKGAYSSLPASFLGETFTLTEMQEAYEAALGTELSASSFRRKVDDLGILEDTGELRQLPSRRPTKLFRLRDGVQTFNRTLG